MTHGKGADGQKAPAPMKRDETRRDDRIIQFFLQFCGRNDLQKPTNILTFIFSVSLQSNNWKYEGLYPCYSLCRRFGFHQQPQDVSKFCNGFKRIKRDSIIDKQ